MSPIGTSSPSTSPSQGWLGSANPFAMGASYEPAPGIRRLVSGTPPIVGMLALQDMLEVLDKAGIAAVREKSVALTSFAIEAVDALLAPSGVVLASPRPAAERGGHITIDHPEFATMVPELWAEGVIPDYRNPSGIRLGLSPLTTTFEETLAGISAIAGRLEHGRIRPVGS
jgi:kynureninase